MIYSGNKMYYPVSYIGSKVLLKDLKPNQLRENGYGDYLKQFRIDYGEGTGGVQDTYCIEKNGLREVLGNSKVGRLSVEQKVAMNGLLKYLGMETIDVEERFINRLSEDKIKEYNVFIQDCIYEVLKENPNIKFQKCTKCGNYYPYTQDFFAENQHSSVGLNTNCKTCQAWSNKRGRIAITHPDRELNTIYKKYGEEIFLMYKNHEVINIYKHYINSQLKKCPKILHNKKDYLEIIKYYYDNNKINDLSIKLLEKDLKLTSLQFVIKLNDLYLCLYGQDYKLHPWKYPLLRLSDISFSEAKQILFNYIKINNIKIDNVYEINYTEIIKNCGLICYVKSDILGFIMKVFDNRYAAYKFKTVGQNYWKNKDNVDQALKFYIEKDQEIPLEKIPLYLTLNNLQKNARTLYYLIHNKRFHKTLFEWVNDIYPNIFEERDFSIGSTRNYFDSKEEEVIYEFLKDEFKNVIYNKRNCDNTVELRGMIPDYIIFTDNACYFIEYYGLYVLSKVGKNKRISDYINKTDAKIENYKTIKHRVIYLYPEDLLENMSGLKEKIRIIV
jgi:hypothetical protein